MTILENAWLLEMRLWREATFSAVASTTIGYLESSSKKFKSASATCVDLKESVCWRRQSGLVSFRFIGPYLRFNSTKLMYIIQHNNGWSMP